jgi:HTH-type transcriptional regulator/antitoxin HipB
MAAITDARQLGVEIRSERIRQGYTQSGLAEEAGVSRAWLARVEAGHRTASVEQVFKVLRVLDAALYIDRPKRTKGEMELLNALSLRGEWKSLRDEPK